MLSVDREDVEDDIRVFFPRSIVCRDASTKVHYIVRRFVLFASFLFTKVESASQATHIQWLKKAGRTMKKLT